MQLINAPGKLVLPFAASGAKNAIPVASQIGIVAGAASLTDGFPPLTRTPLAAGGVPPSGLDMNGIIYELSAILRWANAGAGYVYDDTFATDSNVGGYPKGARVLRSDGAGYWLNTIDGNTVDPESVTVNAAQVAGWVPDLTNGIAAITMTSANVTLTPAQYGKPFVVLSGVLTANLNLIFPNLAGEWTVVNNCTGAFTVTAKTAAGTGVVAPQAGATIIYGDATNIGYAFTSIKTPVQFASNMDIATTEFVQRALGNFSGIQQISVSQQLTIAMLGSLIQYAGLTNGTLTLPDLGAIPLGGYGYQIANGSAFNLTINTFGGQLIYFAGSGAAVTPVLGPGDSVSLVKIAGNWYAFGGSLQLKHATVFGSSLSTSGYQKLPSGLIIQWANITTSAGGVFTWTFPIAFPNAKLSEAVGLMPGNYTVTATGGGATSRSGTLIVANTGAAAGAGLSFQMIAIGY